MHLLPDIKVLAASTNTNHIPNYKPEPLKRKSLRIYCDTSKKVIKHMQCTPCFMAETSCLAFEMHNLCFCLASSGCGCRMWGRRERSTCCPGVLERTELPVIFIPSLLHCSCLFICLSALAPSSPVPLHPPHCAVYIKVMATMLASRSNKKSPMERTKTSLSFVNLSQRLFHISTS